MRKLRYGTAAVAVCGLALLAPALGQDRLPPHLTVSGEASIGVVPDSAQIRVGITSQAKTAREASAANNKAVTALMAALKGAGAAERDIQTTRLSLQPTYEPNRPNGPPRVAGFQATNQVTVKVRDITKLAELIDMAVDAGANDIGGIEFLVSAPSPALDGVRAEAVADARRKAEIYARAAGVKLGRVIALSEDVGHAEPVMMRAAAPAPGVPVAPGEKLLRVSVAVSFELLP